MPKVYQHYQSPQGIRATGQRFNTRNGDGIICEDTHNGKKCGTPMAHFKNITELTNYIKPCKPVCSICGIYLVADVFKREAWSCTKGCTYHHPKWSILCVSCLRRRDDLKQFRVVHGLHH